ncbi:RelA/SpoT domain-containing protein [Oceanobacillus sp. J11TS1]|uniref:RelA/SpoT domain-containing protein n=1 Tax=Oceanobacillus sp. J11TS1 TaxID=2807191 RepID=UPI001B27C79D|nr:GTP pyrophosphokinase [Oceanobacillus sp. J11TS1]GIO23478.1 hypothetical protein J11TS1_20590 [Oceanobacillus sp. J11TS1]
MRIGKDDFMKKYNLDVGLIEKYQINWSEMEAIYKDFTARREQLEVYSNLLADLLRKQSRVHTVRSRIKDPEHLIAKLIRKTPDRQQQKGDEFQFTIDNYRSEITDLIGIRVIHIFKEDWKDIHNYINQTWSIKEFQVNIREGDNRGIYEDLKIPINYRETGYRSVHYLIEFSPTNELLTAEIQVRTIFEEGYGEIDHLLSYPNNNVPEVLTLNLLMLNRLAGSADEMSSAVKTIKEEWNKMQESLSAKDEELKKLENKIDELNIQRSEKESLFEGIDKIKVDTNWINNIGDTIYAINDRVRNISSDWDKGITSPNTDRILTMGNDWNKRITSLGTDGITKIGADSANIVDSNYKEEKQGE